MTQQIILAAGRGSRLFKYTANLPKAMLPFGGMSALERQIRISQTLGVEGINIVTGYEADKIPVFQGVRNFYNDRWHSTGIVGSLFRADEVLQGDQDVVVSYGDVVYSHDVFAKTLKGKGQVGCVIDMDWRPYWTARHGSDTVDTESLILDGDRIVELGEEDPSQDKLHARYVGLVHFRSTILDDVRGVYHQLQKELWNDQSRWRNSSNFQHACMTDFLQELIDQGIDVDAIKINRGWLEFDTNQDYERAKNWLEQGTLSRFIDF